MPTGKTEQPRFQSERQDGSLVPTSRLQRGSGTVDPLFGASLSRSLHDLTGFGSAAARTPLYGNGDGLRTGASSELNAGLARPIRTHINRKTFFKAELVPELSQNAFVLARLGNRFGRRQTP
jgi:hypothetical protein